jgi:cell pole-organizing protein PopZ
VPTEAKGFVAVDVGGRQRTGEDARMTQPAKSQEPSMEEILASIRRIIADDDASKSAPRPAEPPPPAAAAVAPAPAARPAPPPQAPPPAPPRVAPPEPSLDEAEAADPEPLADVEDQASDILDLTEQMAAPMPAPAPKPAPQFRTIDGNFDVSYDEEKPSPQMPPQMPEARAPFPAEDNPHHGDGRSNQLLSSVTSAAVDSAFNTLAQTVLVQNARTLEDLVREMLRPMLKAWLDDNLPGMVERLVRAEIERVSRGRMG